MKGQRLGACGREDMECTTFNEVAKMSNGQINSK